MFSICMGRPTVAPSIPKNGNVLVLVKVQYRTATKLSTHWTELSKLTLRGSDEISAALPHCYHGYTSRPEAGCPATNDLGLPII